MRQTSVEFMTFMMGLLMGFFLLAILVSLIEANNLQDKTTPSKKEKEVRDGSD